MRTRRWVCVGLVALVASAAACGEDGSNLDGSGGNTTSSSGTGGSTTSSSSGGGSGGGVVASGALVINEVMANPDASSDELGEWVELYNPGSEAVDLEGWKLRDGGAVGHTITNLVVPPDGYVVLGRSADQNVNGGAPVDQAFGDALTLANGGDTVVLENDAGEVIDQIAYLPSAPWPLDTAGISLELSAPSLDNALGQSWQHAVLTYGDGDLGTPGGPNGGDVGGYQIDESVVSWHQPALSASINFAPSDDLEAIVLDQLAAAQTSIRLAFFNIRLPEVKDMLVQRQAAGVDVHVVLDAKQQDLSYNTMGEELVQAGIPVTLVSNDSAVNATMHDKFTVVDGHLVMTGSANYSYTALNVSDEDLIRIDDADLAARYLEEFDELVAGDEVVSAPYAPNAPVQAWMGPEDGLADKVVALLDGAQSTALVAMFELNTQSVVDALIAAHQRGVAVVVVLDEVQATDPAALADEELAGAGVAVVLADNTGSQAAEMHSKFLVVDHQRLLMGSYNWSNMGSYYNDENIVVIDDAQLATRVEGKMAELLQTYPAPPPSSLGLESGTQTITFEVGNVTLDAGVQLFLVTSGAPHPSGVALDASSVTFDVAAGTRVEYHYEIRKQGSTLLSEGGQHAFTVPFASGPFLVSDAFVK